MVLCQEMTWQMSKRIQVDRSSVNFLSLWLSLFTCSLAFFFIQHIFFICLSKCSTDSAITSYYLFLWLRFVVALYHKVSRQANFYQIQLFIYLYILIYTFSIRNDILSIEFYEEIFFVFFSFVTIQRDSLFILSMKVCHWKLISVVKMGYYFKSYR